MRIFKITSSSLILLMMTSFIYAGSIKGHVISSQGGKDIAFASIAIIKSGEQEAFAGAISDDNGNFIVKNIPNGNYSAIVSFIGFNTKEVKNITVSSTQSRVELGNIVLNPNAIKLNDIEVSATQQTSVQKIDRQTFRASDFATAKGGTAVDILGKLPSVTVDGEGEVAVRGTRNFVVYINGKPTSSNASMILNQIPSDNIQSIDIITVPTSKYEAQGKGGIINISTKRSTIEGFSLVANGMLGGTPWTNADDVYSKQKLNNDRYNTGLNFVYNKNKLSLNGGISMQSRNNKGKGIIDPYIYQMAGEVTNVYPGKYYVFDGIGSRPKWYSNFAVNAGLNYDLNEKSDIALNYQYAKRKSGRTANYKYDAYFADSPTDTPINETLIKIYNPNDIHRNGWFSNLALDYNLKINETSKLTASVIYESSELTQTIENHEFAYNTERYYLDDSPGFHSFQSDKTPLNAYRAALDYIKSFQNGNQLEAGVQAQLVDLDGIFRYDTIVGNAYYGDVDSYDNDIDLNRDIYAAYIDFSGSRDRLSYILGLRMEYLNQTMNVTSTSYFPYVYKYFNDVGTGRDFSQKDFSQSKLDLFPSLHLNYKVNKTNNLSFGASRRINRPPAKDMAPFLYRRHQEIYEMGDPLLEPEYILNTELKYTKDFGKHNVTLTGFYRGVDNAIYRVNRVAYDMGNPGGVLLRSYTNAGNQRATGAELGLNLDLFDQVKCFIGGALYDFRVIADDELLGESRNSQSTNWNLKSNVVWDISKPLKFTVDYSIKSGSVTPQGEKLKFQALNAVLNYSPDKLKGWSFSAKMLDILGTNQAGGYTAAYKGNQILLRRDYVYDYEGQIIEFAVSYSFNHKKQKAKTLIGEDYF